VQVLIEYLRVWDLTHDIHLLTGHRDKLCWKWTADKIFSTSSAYSAFFIGQHPIERAKLLRKVRAPAKCKIFIWLVLHDRCWTADRRKKHGLQEDDSCALCAQLPETIDHLLLCCPFSKQVWLGVLRKLGWEAVFPDRQQNRLVAWWSDAWKKISKDEKQCFDSIVVLICWLLWKERNDRILIVEFVRWLIP